MTFRQTSRLHFPVNYSIRFKEPRRVEQLVTGWIVAYQ